MKNIFLLFISIGFSTLFAQNGTIRGTVIEDESGETVIGANVAILDPLTGTSTDLDGQFSINIPEGNYTLQVTYISFQKTIIENIIVKAGEVSSIGNVRMQSSALALEEVVVTATATRKSEAALNTMKKKSATMMDGISAQKMALTGDGTAIEAAQRVTGVTIEGGKYVYVRGLGDRYSKVTLNGMDIPGLDPDKNSLQMDIFPTSLIDNIVVSKTFSADQAADFTGGLVNIETKAFPDEKIVSVTAGVSYNPSMHFNQDYLSYEGGKTDFLGFDNGTRSLPKYSLLPTPIRPQVYADEVVNNYTNSFNPTMGAEEQMSFMNYSLGFTIGDQIELNKNKKDKKRDPKLGYIFSLTYKADQEYYDDAKFGEYQAQPGNEDYEMVYVDKIEGRLAKQSVLIGAIGGLAYKTKYSKYKLSLMRLQNGESTSGIFSLDNNGSGGTASGYIGESNNLEYNQRSITNALINGSHIFKGSGWELDWRISPTISKAEDPDIRQTPFTFSPTDTLFLPGAAGVPTRIWRDLNEFNNSSRIDFSKKFKLLQEDAKLSFGLSHSYKNRDYQILIYSMDFWSGNQIWQGTDPNQVYDPNIIYPNTPNSVYMVPGNDLQYSESTNSNAYKANSNNLAYYASLEFNPLPNLKSVVGLRVEKFVLKHTGRDQDFATGNGGNNLDNEEVLNSTDLFPSVNLIYTVAEEQNLRFSFTQTIARPSFKELSFAQILDPITGRTFNGSLFPVDNWEGNLVETRINNFDLRWEKFLERGQIYSVSLFYKSFTNPIESVRFSTAPGFQYQSRNVGDAQLLGIEIEATKSLEFLSSKLRDFSLSGNFTYVKSQVDMTELEFQARKDFEKSGETIKNNRAMAGQAPFVVNLGVSYQNIENGISGGVFYNVKGPTLLIVGNGLNPDVYQEPFHSLNIGAAKKIGKDRKTTIDVKLENLLFDVQESFYKSYEADDQIFTSLEPGLTISFGINHKF